MDNGCCVKNEKSVQEILVIITKLNTEINLKITHFRELDIFFQLSDFSFYRFCNFTEMKVELIGLLTEQHNINRVSIKTYPDNIIYEVPCKDVQQEPFVLYDTFLHP